MTIWLTSDWHLGHERIIPMTRRPFSDVTNMNKLLIANHNEVVQPDDIVYMVGDFAMGDRTHSVPLAEQLNGELHLIPGNHDHVHPMHGRKVEKWRSWYEDAGFIIEEPEIVVDGLLICHFPYEGDSHDEDRYEEWRPKDTGTFLAHGHTHAKERVRGKQIHVGVDAWNYYPVKLADLVAEEWRTNG